MDAKPDLVEIGEEVGRSQPVVREAPCKDNRSRDKAALDEDIPGLQSMTNRSLVVPVVVVVDTLTKRNEF